MHGIPQKPETLALLARLRQIRGRLPVDFHFDRIEANDRNCTASSLKKIYQKQQPAS